MKPDLQIRARIAQEAARVMSEEGISDYKFAKKKAAERLGITDLGYLPKNSEIEKELLAYQRIFHGATQPMQLKQLRQAALEAMEFFEIFQPRLVGSVLKGTANGNSDVNLHLFADYPEEVDYFLLNHDIPFTRGRKKIRLDRDTFEAYPSYRFLAGETEIELVVLPTDAIRHSPRSPVDGKAMRRAGIPEVKSLIEDAS